MNEQEIKIQQLEKRVAELEKQVAAATATSVDEIVAKAERVFLVTDPEQLSELFDVSPLTISSYKNRIRKGKRIPIFARCETVIDFFKISSSIDEELINKISQNDYLFIDS